MHSPDNDDRLTRRIRGRNTLLAGCGTTVAVFMLAVFGYLAWANTLPPPERDRRVLPSPNGYDACALAMGNLPPLTSPNAPWGADIEVLRKDLAPARPGLAALSTAVRLPYMSPPSDPNNFRQFTHYREAARQLGASTRVELAAGHPGVAMDAALDAVELGAKLGRGGALLDSLVGVACIAIGQNGAERCVSHLSAEDAHAAGVRLDGIMLQLPEPADVMDEERRASLLMVRGALSGKSPIATSPAASGNPVNWWDNAKERVLLTLYPKSWGYRQVDQYWRALAAEVRKPYAQRKSPRPTPPEWDPVLGGMSMELPTLQLPFARTRAYLRLLRTELALREFRLRHGAYPAKLEALAPEALAVVPVDPFSEQPLRYRRQGNGYVLYSVGPDLKDDGGTPIVSRGVDASSKGDLVAGKLFSPRKAAPASRGRDAKR